MAHFAYVSETGIVEKIVFVSNDSVLDEDGIESESIGVSYCTQHVEAGRWVQTSINTKNGIHYSPETGLPDGGRPLRRTYAKVGGLYIEALDIFIDQRPAGWYELSETGEWYVPFGIHPETGLPLDKEQIDWVLIVGRLPRPIWPSIE